MITVQLSAWNLIWIIPAFVVVIFVMWLAVYAIAERPPRPRLRSASYVRPRVVQPAGTEPVPPRVPKVILPSTLTNIARDGSGR